MPTTPISYIGVVPPRLNVGIGYRMIPTLAGSGGGGSPVTPVPVGVVLGGGTTGTVYSETISAQGGSGGYVYALQSGSLPTSTSLNTSTGVISGTPTVAGTYSFTIKVTDSSSNVGTQNFSITITSPSAGGGGAWTFLN